MIELERCEDEICEIEMLLKRRLMEEQGEQLWDTEDQYRNRAPWRGPKAIQASGV